MNQIKLGQLASEARRLERLTSHLKLNGKPLHSLAIELEAEKARDPLRPLLSKNQGES